MTNGIATVSIDNSYRSVVNVHTFNLQTWDLLRVMHYGFKALCTDFLTRHPGYRISPHDVNGSVVETVFGQMRQVSQHNLSAANYAWTRGSLLTKWSLTGKRKGKASDDYRQAPLYMRQSDLIRKKS